MLSRFCVVRLLFDFILWLFRDDLVFFDPDSPVLVSPFPILILLRLLLGEETPSFFFSTPAKVEIRANSKQKHPFKLIFSAQNEILGEKIQ